MFTSTAWGIFIILIKFSCLTIVHWCGAAIVLSPLCVRHTLSETREGLICVASGSCARGMFRYVTIYIAQLPGHNEYNYQYHNTIYVQKLHAIYNCYSTWCIQEIIVVV